MVNFEHYNPVRIVFEPGAAKKVGQYGKQLGGTKALVVSYDKHAYMSALLDAICANLEENGIKAYTHYVVQPNPLMSGVQAGVDICRKEGINLVIGVGGGSVMDTAKVIAAGVPYKYDLWKMFTSRQDASIDIIPPAESLKKILIPTLPATSSEMNSIAVVTNDETVEKAFVMNDVLYSDVSLMDPEITCSLPAYQTACGAVDAISHVLEAYFNCAPDTPLQDRLQEGCVVTIKDLVFKILADPQNVALRASMQWASSLAWNGWLQAGVAPGSPMHPIGHVLSARYGVTHGATLGIVMPAFFRYVAKQRADRFVMFGEKMLGLDLSGMDQYDAAMKAIDEFEKFIASVGVQTRLSQVGVKPEDFELIASDAIRVSGDTNGNLPSNPPVGKDGVIEVLKLAL